MKVPLKLFKGMCFCTLRSNTEMHMRKVLSAFTLAETLITMLILGVIGILTIPVMMENINDKVLTKQKVAAERKLAEGFAQMRVASALETKYESTEEFVGAMQKYFKISNVCSADKLTNCFSSVVKETIEENSTQKTIEDYIVEMENVDKVVGIQFADGVQMLVKYNPEGTPIESTQNEVGVVNLSNPDAPAYPTYNDLFLYVIDINSTKKPNFKGKDIVGNLPLAKKRNPYGLSFEIANNGTSFSVSDAGYVMVGSQKDYWQAAKNYCEDRGWHLPTVEQTNEIAEKIYKNAQCTRNSTKNGQPWYEYCNVSIVSGSELYQASLTTWTANAGYFRNNGPNYSDYNNDPNWRRVHGANTFFCVK